MSRQWSEQRAFVDVPRNVFESIIAGGLIYLFVDGMKGR